MDREPSAPQSRRDYTLLTVDFNLRTGQDREPLCAVVPQGRHFVAFRPNGRDFHHRRSSTCGRSPRRSPA
ncbi:MAG: hypothetical protein LBU62_09055 [Bacteroidales bacterium]|nr:hypothetical protein [Bacteroidales bacterium]